MPEPARLKLKPQNGEITLQGLRGAKVGVELVNGRMVVRNSFAEVRTRASAGVLDAVFEWWEKLPATFDFAFERGRIGVHLPGSARFRVDARSADGRIESGFPLPPAASEGSAQQVTGATASGPSLSLGLRLGRGNILLEPIR